MKNINIKPYKILMWSFRTVFIFGMCYLFLFPILYFLSVAIRDASSVSDPTVVWIPKSISFESITQAMKYLDYLPSVSLTIFISVLSTVGSLISCSLVGYGLARFNFFEKKLIFALVIFTIIVPPQTILVPSYLNYRYFNPAGILTLFKGLSGVEYIDFTEMPLAPLTFILPSLLAVGIRAGLFTFIFRQFFKGIPKELEEAASIDGCGHMKIYLKIILPLAIPSIITVLLFSFIWHWNDYYASAIYFPGDLKPISVMLSNLTAALKQDGMGAQTNIEPYKLRTFLAAGSLLTILPPLTVYMFTQKYFTESIERTGIVG